jgi:hypothetical protein
MGGSKLTVKRYGTGRPYAAIRWTVNVDRNFMAQALAVSNPTAATFNGYGKAQTRRAIESTLRRHGIGGVQNGLKRVPDATLAAAFMQIDHLWPELGDVQPVGASHDS